METLKDIETLARFGIFNPEGIHRLAELIRSIQALSMESAESSAPETPPASGRPPAAGRAPEGASRKDDPARKRTRGSLNVSRDELAELRSTMTGQAIARKFGVSLSTVQNHLRKHGLTRGRGKEGI
jgi:hypothetical protein